MCSVLGRLIAHVLKIHSIDNELYLSNKKKNKQTNKQKADIDNRFTIFRLLD